MKKIIVGTFFVLLVLFTINYTVNAQRSNVQGIIIGSLVDQESGKAISSATVKISLAGSDNILRITVSGKDGYFSFMDLPYAVYRLRFSSQGYADLVLDSISVRQERSDFDLNDIKLSRKAVEMAEVIVYAERPLIEQKEGKIIFNTGESALSNGANTTELLKQTPLVNVDNDGKISLRGKDAKILIDDKPVELNAKQLQDLLESMPGSMIEKIEVMTTPPPQYATERGGVINIVTKKGRTGIHTRLSVNYGTRGEAGASGSVGYRKSNFSLQVNAGFSSSSYNGDGSGVRQNFYADSSNFFITKSHNNNINSRPNLRININYDLTKKQNISLTLQYNNSNTDNTSNTSYANISAENLVYSRSVRNINNQGNILTPVMNLTYILKFGVPGDELKLIAGYTGGKNDNDKYFYQQYFGEDNSTINNDSTQTQSVSVKNSALTLRVNCDKVLKQDKCFLNTGGNINYYTSDNVQVTQVFKKPENIFFIQNALSNDFMYKQCLYAGRASLRYNVKKDINVTGGVQAEETIFRFTLGTNSPDAMHNYLSILPFATFVRKWKNDITLTVSYKRTVQRPGIAELNPAVDYTDPYNSKSGNPFLKPSYADNFDLIVGKWHKKYFANFSAGYNRLQDIYNTVKILLTDGKTFATWQNISGRKEYEVNAWGGYTLSKKSKANISIGYSFNEYSRFDRAVKKFINGGSFFTTCTGSYQFTELLITNYSFTYNRFANPQGSVRNNLSMNLGVQRKFLKKKLSVSFNVIDPFVQQQNKTITNGNNFVQESISNTYTRNFRISFAYTFNKNSKSRG